MGFAEKKENMIAPLFWLLLLCIGAHCQSEDTDNYYRPNVLYDCTDTILCPAAADTCDGENSVRYPLCSCDRECWVYGDCCANASICDASDTDQNTANRLDGLLQCRSIHLDPRTQPDWIESFWMVSACPADWLAGRNDQLLLDTLNNCTSGSANLPPVTDVESGIVYKNEYCAVCHEVETFQLWGYRFECTPWLRDMVESPDFQLTIEIVERECIPCGFRRPQGLPFARNCLHNSLTYEACLRREELQDVTRVPIEEEQYQEIVSQCQSGPVSPVVMSDPKFPPFQNQYCAICNAINVNVATEDLTCVFNPYFYRDETDHCEEEAANLMPVRPTTPTPTPLTLPTVSLRPSDDNFTAQPDRPLFIAPPLDYDYDFVPDSFTIFLDVNGDSQVVRTETVSVTIPISCSDGQVFDPITQMCRATICPESARGESCAIVQNITLSRGSNTTENDSLPCDGALIALNDSEFQLLTDNQTLLFRDEEFDILDYIDNMPIICTNFSENGTVDINITVLFYSYPAAFSIVTYIGCSLSLFGCALVLLTYGLFRELRTLPGKILMNLSATILATCLFIVVGVPLFALAEREELCQTTAIFLHWLVLCQFSWMAIMSYELARTLIRATHLKPVQDKNTKRHILLVYMLIGWGLPTVITGVSVIVNYFTDYIQYGVDGFCWIGHADSLYIVFIAPVALSIVLNSICFSVSVYLLFRASRSEAKLKKENTTSYFRIYLSVFSITGLTWVFGFVAILSRGDWAWYLFIILTSTQGFTICIAFLFTRKVFSMYKQFFWPKISRTLSFKSSMKQSTQDTSMAIRYSKKNETVSTVSSDFTAGKVSETEPSTNHKKQDVE